MTTEEAYAKLISKLQAVEDTIAALHLKQTEMRETQITIKGALVGNEEFGQPGLAKEVHKHFEDDKVDFNSIREGQQAIKDTITENDAKFRVFTGKAAVLVGLAIIIAKLIFEK